MFIDVDENIVLDEDQINAIVNDDDYVLILAGAGTGKTTTMVGKVKYLVDIKKVDPSKILVISYTKKAVEELRELINDKQEILNNLNQLIENLFKILIKIIRIINFYCIIVNYFLKLSINFISFYEFL